MADKEVRYINPENGEPHCVYMDTTRYPDIHQIKVVFHRGIPVSAILLSPGEPSMKTNKENPPSLPSSLSVLYSDIANYKATMARMGLFVEYD